VPHQGRRGVAVARVLRVTLTPATCPTCGCSSNSRTKCGSAWPLDSVFTKSRFCNSLPHRIRRAIDATSWRLHRSHVSRGFKEVDLRQGCTRGGNLSALFYLSMPGFFLARRGQSEKFNLPLPTEPRSKLSGARKTQLSAGNRRSAIDASTT
jgi:hypothetical protein